MQFIPSFCVRMVSSCRINMITMPAKMIRRSCGVSMAFHRNYHQSAREETPLKPPKQGSKSLKAQETRIQQSWWEDIHVCIYIYIRTYMLHICVCKYIYIYIYIPCPTLPLEFSSEENDIPCFNNPRWSQQPFSCCSPLAFLCTSANFQLKAWKILVVIFWCEMAVFRFFWCQKTEHSMFWGTINRSITHTLSGDPAGTKPPSRLKLLLRKRCGTRPDFWNNEGSSSAICPTFGLTCFFFRWLRTRKMLRKAFGNIFRTRKKLSDRSEELIQNIHYVFIHNIHYVFIYNLIFYPSNKKNMFQQPSTFSIIIPSCGAGEFQGINIHQPVISPDHLA